MSISDLVAIVTRTQFIPADRKEPGHRAASARYRAKNLELCRARVRASKLKAKQRKKA